MFLAQVVVDAPPTESVPWMLVGFLLFGSAIVSWGLTQAVKQTFLNRVKFKDDVSTKEASKRLWWTPLLVIVSIAIGFGIGCLVGGLEWKTLYGGLVGAIGGALASFLVSLFKGNLTELMSRFVSKVPSSGQTEEDEGP